jgi:hypothetical protein
LRSAPVIAAQAAGTSSTSSPATTPVNVPRISPATAAGA